MQADPGTIDASDSPGEPAWRRRIAGCAAVFTAGVIAASLAACAGRAWWIFDLASHFRVPYFFGLLCGAVALAATRRWKSSLAAGLLAAAHGALLWPFYVADEDARPSHHNLRILSYNVHSINRRHADVLKFVREQSPDIAVFLEVSDVWADVLASLADDWPHSLTRAHSGNFGVALYSRMPLEGARIEYLSDRCPAVVAQVGVAGDRVTIFGVHPYPPMGRGATELRNRQLTALADLIVAASGETVVVGDLNTTSWSTAFTDLAGRTGLSDSRAGLGVQPSWPSAWPWLMRIPIDHCLVSPGIRVAQRRLGPDVGSDHLPLIADLLAGRNQSP